MTIATLIARAFGVLDQSAAVHTTAPGSTRTGAPERHLHVVRDTNR